MALVNKITITNVAIIFGLVSLITPASAMTHFFTDGEFHASWSVPDDEEQAGAKSEAGGVPPPFPENPVVCEFGKYGLEEERPDVIVTTVSTEIILQYIEACKKFIEEGDSHQRERRSLHRQKRAWDVKLIYPGTKWCGTGNIASGRRDLGRLRNLDKCCREHDGCSDIIKNGKKRGGIKNTRGYTMLNCNCDEKFRECLYKINDFDANLVGATYFNTLKNKCFLPKPGSRGKKLILYKSDPYKPCVRINILGAIHIEGDC